MPIERRNPVLELARSAALVPFLLLAGLWNEWMERKHGPGWGRGEPGDHWGPDCRCARCEWLRSKGHMPPLDYEGSFDQWMKSRR